MMTDHYPYRLAAVYPDQHTADTALDTVIATVTDDIRAVGLEPNASDVDAAIGQDSVTTGETLTRVAAGAPELFVSAPVVAPLIVLGYGGVLGGTAGSIHGLRLREHVFANLVKDALRADFHVVILHAASATARRQAATALDGTLSGH
jgi:hypothetical protein